MVRNKGEGTIGMQLVTVLFMRQLGSFSINVKRNDCFCISDFRYVAIMVTNSKFCINYDVHQLSI